MKYHVGQRIVYTKEMNKNHVLCFSKLADHPDLVGKTGKIIAVSEYEGDDDYRVKVEFDNEKSFYLTDSDLKFAKSNITKYYL